MFLFYLAEVMHIPQNPLVFANYYRYSFFWNSLIDSGLMRSLLFWTRSVGMIGESPYIWSQFSSIIFFHFNVSWREDSSWELDTITHPRAPLMYILLTELNLYCPAISQSWRRMCLPSTVDLSLVEKSQPMVGRELGSNFLKTYW